MKSSKAPALTALTVVCRQHTELSDLSHVLCDFMDSISDGWTLDNVSAHVPSSNSSWLDKQSLVRLLDRLLLCEWPGLNQTSAWIAFSMAGSKHWLGQVADSGLVANQVLPVNESTAFAIMQSASSCSRHHVLEGQAICQSPMNSCD